MEEGQLSLILSSYRHPSRTFVVEQGTENRWGITLWHPTEKVFGVGGPTSNLPTQATYHMD